MNPAILTDLTRCIGCEACVWACKEINGLSREDSGPLSAETWTTLERKQGVVIRRHCMHCEDPSCVSVCPVGAMHKAATGAVVWDKELCIGCRYCMVGCPFNMPKYEWDSPVPEVRKCIMCSENRLAKGQQPACTAACPTGATKFGDRDELIHEAHHRIDDAPDRYVNHIYGVKEAGGTSVLYLSPVPFEKLGFQKVQEEPYPEFTWAVLSRLPQVVASLGVAMTGIWWITHRRDAVARAEKEQLEKSPRLKEVRKKENSEKS